MKINNNRNTLQRSSAYEKKTLEERIKKLLEEKKGIIKNIEETNKAKIIDDLQCAIEELEERIEALKKEKKDILLKMGEEEIIGKLKCPKDFLCYRTNYKKLGKAQFVGNSKILLCLENPPQACIFSSSSNDISFCQCPLRNYIANNYGM